MMSANYNNVKNVVVLYNDKSKPFYEPYLIYIV